MPELFIPEDELLSHRNNLNQKFRLTDSVEHQTLCREIKARYDAYINALRVDAIAAGDLVEAVEAVGKYLDFAKGVEKDNQLFNWRSDFAGSILPEFVYLMLGISLASNNLPQMFSTRNSIVEVTLSGNSSGGWEVRRKDQDLCMGLRRDRIVHLNGEDEFLIPLIVMEVKTNIDINKLNGLDFSAERLKRTFPTAKYFLITETIDFSLNQNYASGSIDEIYTLRRQVRSQARREKKPLESDVFSLLQNDVIGIAKKASLTLGHVYDRLKIGKLINANQS